MRAKRGTAGTVSTVADKAFQLLQVALGRLRVETAGAVGMAAFSLRMETRTTAEVSAKRDSGSRLPAQAACIALHINSPNDGVDNRHGLTLARTPLHHDVCCSFAVCRAACRLIMQLAARIAKAFTAFCLTPETRCALAPTGHVAARALARSLWPEEPADRLLLQLVSCRDNISR